MNIGIDIGGSHIGIGLVDFNGEIIKQKDIYIKVKDRYNIKNFIEKEIIGTLKVWEKNNIQIKKIGIAAPGIVSNGEIKYSVNLGLFGYNLKEKLFRQFPNAKICVKNDAKCAALAEKKIGALKKYDDCIFLCLGTGIGGAAFYNGKLVEPKRSSGFEYGHMVIKRNGRACKCGNRGCFEQYGSMRVFKNNIRYHLKLPRNTEGEKLRMAIRKNIDKEIVKKVIDNFLENLCIGIANIVNILEPKAICIGGGFAKYEDILMDRFKEKFYKTSRLFYKDNLPKIVIAELGNRAGIIGSALYIK